MPKESILVTIQRIQDSLKYFSVEDGLPQNSVTDTAINLTGEMLIATYSGVVAFDGNTFSKKIPNSDQLFPNLEASVIAIDHDNAIWVGTTTKGLYRIKDGIIKNWQKEDGFISNYITRIQTSKSGVFFVSNAILYSIKPNTADTVEKVSSTKFNNYNLTTFISADNYLTVVDKSGIWIYKSGA